MHPLIKYIRDDDKYLVNPNEKLEKFREYIRNHPEYNKKKPALIKLLDAEKFLERKFIELNDIKHRKRQGIPKKLPPLIPKKKTTPPSIDELLSILKKAKV